MLRLDPNDLDNVHDWLENSKIVAKITGRATREIEHQMRLLNDYAYYRRFVIGQALRIAQVDRMQENVSRESVSFTRRKVIRAKKSKTVHPYPQVRLWLLFCTCYTCGIFLTTVASCLAFQTKASIEQRVPRTSSSGGMADISTPPKPGGVAPIVASGVLPHFQEAPDDSERRARYDTDDSSEKGDASASDCAVRATSSARQPPSKRARFMASPSTDRVFQVELKHVYASAGDGGIDWRADLAALDGGDGSVCAHTASYKRWLFATPTKPRRIVPPSRLAVRFKHAVKCAVNPRDENDSAALQRVRLPRTACDAVGDTIRARLKSRPLTNPALITKFTGLPRVACYSLRDLVFFTTGTIAARTTSTIVTLSNVAHFNALFVRPIFPFTDVFGNEVTFIDAEVTINATQGTVAFKYNVQYEFLFKKSDTKATVAWRTGERKRVSDEAKARMAKAVDESGDDDGGDVVAPNPALAI